MNLKLLENMGCRLSKNKKLIWTKLIFGTIQRQKQMTKITKIKQFIFSLLPKGAWDNDLSKTLPKKDWDLLRNKCYGRANHRCEICGYQTDDLDAHEVWDFNVNKKTQTLKNIIGICSRCHGVIHLRNSQRLAMVKMLKDTL